MSTSGPKQRNKNKVVLVSDGHFAQEVLDAAVCSGSSHTATGEGRSLRKRRLVHDIALAD